MALAGARRRRPRSPGAMTVLCCGDLVGYGATNQVVDWVRAHCAWWCGVITTRSPPARRIWNGSTRLARAAALWTQQN